MDFPKLAKRTRESRLAFLAKIGVTKPSDYTLLRNPNSIYKRFIASDKPTVEATRIFHVIEFLKSIDQTALENKYRAMAQDIIAEAKRHEEDNRLESDPRASRYLPLDDLKQILRMAPDNVDKLLVSLYVNNPPQRNNFYNINVVKKEADIDPLRNNLVVNTRGITLITDLYKTFKVYGRLKLKLSNETSRLIRLLNFPVFSEEAFKARLRRASLRVFGKPLTINDYRHIYEIDLQHSDKYKDMTILEKRKAHEALKHSGTTAQKYNRV